MSPKKVPPRISRDLPEYGEVEHQLQVLLNAPRMVIEDLFDLRNSRCTEQFLVSARSQNPQNIAVVFIPASEVSQTAEDILLHGLRVNTTTGLRVCANSLNVQRSAEWIEVFRVTVALGRVLNHQPPTYTKSRDVPFNERAAVREDLQDHDSLCMSEDWELVVFDSSQVQCCNMVRFRGGANLAQAEEDALCDLCHVREATVWCVNDSAKFCPECDALSHINEIHLRHREMTIQEGRAFMEYCPDHPELHVEYYCQECNVPVCIECKMVGSHARGAHAVHELKRIRTVYDEAVRLARAPSPIVARRRSQIAAKLEEVDRAANSVWKNTEDVIRQIREAAEQAIEQAKLLGGKKLLEIRSARSELLRQERDIDAVTKSMNDHREHSGPIAFIQAVHRQNLISSNLQEQAKKGQENVEVQQKVIADLVLRGSLRVVATGVAVEEEKPKTVAEEEEEETGTSAASSPSSPSKHTGFTSLAGLAEKRKERAKSRGVVHDLTFAPFEESEILATPEIRLILYGCCPFKGQPFTRLLFSTELHGRSIKTMHQQIDEAGITMVILQRGDYQFGGFAATKWRRDGQPFGQKGSSFLFSITKDAHLPLSGDGQPALIATDDRLSFGEYDLVLAGNFDDCSSEIGHSYGARVSSPGKGGKVRFGSTPGTPEAESFLAGESKFSADAVEVWGFFNYGE
jgi:hypothetical protein